MDDVTLELATTLQKQIKQVASTLEYWKGSTRLYDGQVNCYYELMVVNQQNPDGYMVRNNQYLAASPETFLVVKALNIDYWQRQLDELNKKYSEL